MRNPPTLLSLAIDSAVINFSRISDLSFIPEHILLELFVVCMHNLNPSHPLYIYMFIHVKRCILLGFFMCPLMALKWVCLDLSIGICFGCDLLVLSFGLKKKKLFFCIYFFSFWLRFFLSPGRDMDR